MKKPARYVLYVIIILICIAAIVIGVYAQFFKREVDNELGEGPIDGNGTSNTISYAEIKENFKDLFTNEFSIGNFDDSNIHKIDNTKPLVYTAVELDEESDGKYDMNISIPLININGIKYNATTQSIFVEKINEIRKNSNLFTRCDINYTAYINNDILSVAIMASIKEGDSAQRIIVQTYNCNLKTGKEVTVNDILKERGLEEKIVSNRINTVVKKAAEDAKSMQSTGYNVYERDVESSMYEISEINNFIQGPQGELYIIFAYGNDAFTSEMDIIEI